MPVLTFAGAAARATRRPRAGPTHSRPRPGVRRREAPGRRARPGRAARATTPGSRCVPARASSAEAFDRGRSGHRGVGVGGGDDARLDRDRGAGQPVGVAAAVPALVVVADRGGGSRSAGTRRTTSSPTTGCVRITRHSSSSSGPGLSRIRDGIAALPTSWSQPPSRQRSTTPAGSAMRSATPAASDATCLGVRLGILLAHAWRVARTRARSRPPPARRTARRPSPRAGRARRGCGRGAWRRRGSGPPPRRARRGSSSPAPARGGAERDRQADAHALGGNRRARDRRAQPLRAPVELRVGAARRCSSTANSSPPQRARQSSGPRRGPEPARSSTSTASPDDVAVRVVDLLEVVGVEQQQPAAVAGRPPAPRRRSRRSGGGCTRRSARRSGRARSASARARRSSSSSRRRSVMSRVTPS